MSLSAQSPLQIQVDTKTLTPGQIVDLTGSVDKSLANQPVVLEIRDSENNVILIRTVTPDSDGSFSLKFKVPSTVKSGDVQITANIESEGQPITESKSITANTDEQVVTESSKPKCGLGTIEKDGMCVPAPTEKKTTQTKSGGGCLIATATFDSELTPQVQLLRELRDNTLLGTSSGVSFMTSFNAIYYTFSPTISDLERQNPLFKETVKITLTPMLSTLSILNYVDIDSEQEVVGYGMGIILLNLGMYFVAPAVVMWKLKSLKSRKQKG